MKKLKIAGIFRSGMSKNKIRSLGKIPYGGIEDVYLPPAVIIHMKMQGKAPVYKLPVDKEFFIGKNPENDLCLQGEGISDVHAKIRPQKEGYMLYDLGSGSGVTVNWNNTVKHVLEHADRIKVGSYILTFEFMEKDDDIFEGVERRKTVRVDHLMSIKFLVYGSKMSEEFSGVIRDISLDGAKIKTQKELKKGALLETGISSKELPLVEIIAQVIWTDMERNNSGVVYEVGLQFVEMDEESRDRLKNYLVKCVS